MVHRIIAVLILLASAASAPAQVTSDTKDYQIAKKILQLRTRQLDSIVTVITAASTHRMSPTAKAVYDFVVAYVVASSGGHVFQDDGVTRPQRDTANFASTATINATVTDGGGKSTVTYSLAQQSATTGQVLRWSGTAWVPNGLNLYDVVTTSQTVAVQYNQVFVNTLTAAITLNLPACNAANNGVKFEFIKAGADTFGVDVEPAGSETFNDATSTKTIFSRGTGLSCTCRWSGSSGSWFYLNM